MTPSTGMSLTCAAMLRAFSSPHCLRHPAEITKHVDDNAPEDA
jgi:hypothetical protein